MEPTISIQEFVLRVVAMLIGGWLTEQDLEHPEPRTERDWAVDLIRGIRRKYEIGFKVKMMFDIRDKVERGETRPEDGFNDLILILEDAYPPGSEERG